MRARAVKADIDSIVDRYPLRAFLIAFKAVVVGNVSNVHCLFGGWPDLLLILGLEAHPAIVLHVEAAAHALVVDSSYLLLLLAGLPIQAPSVAVL